MVTLAPSGEKSVFDVNRRPLCDDALKVAMDKAGTEENLLTINSKRTVLKEVLGVGRSCNYCSIQTELVVSSENDGFSAC